MRRDPPVAVVLGLGALGSLAAGLAGLGLAWDGAMYFFTTLQRGVPFTIHRRWAVMVLEFPIALIGRFELPGSPRVPLVLFSLLFALVPVLALACSWLVVRHERPELFVWPALAIGLGTLPGQAFLVSEALIAVQLAWPVLLWAALGAPRTSRRIFALVVGLVVVVLLAHPAASGLLVLAAALLAVRARGDARERVARWLLAGGFVLLGVGRFLLVTGAGYETDSLSVRVLRQHFASALAGAPLGALLFAWGAGVALLVAHRTRNAEHRQLARVLAWVAAAGAGALLVWWAMDMSRWQAALDFRTWALPATVPFIILLGLDTAPRERRLDAEEATAPARLVPRPPGIAVVPLLAFTIVLSLQGLSWHGLQGRFTEVVTRQPPGCMGGPPLVADTPLTHWGRRAASMVVQGRAPRVVMLDPPECLFYVVNRRVPLAPRPTIEIDPAEPGYFDLSELGRTFSLTVGAGGAPAGGGGAAPR